MLQAAREKPRKLAYHGKQLVPHSLISNAIVFYDMERMMGKIGKGEGEGDGERCKQRYKHLFFFSVLLQLVRVFFVLNGQLLNSIK